MMESYSLAIAAVTLKATSSVASSLSFLAIQESENLKVHPKK
jgi:hypothetical protein